MEAIHPICVPVAPSCAAKIGNIGDFDMVELKMANAPQQPIMINIRNPVLVFFNRLFLSNCFV